MTQDSIQMIGYGSDLAGALRGSSEGPVVIKNSSLLDLLTRQGLTLNWVEILQPDIRLKAIDKIVQQLCTQLALFTTHSVLEKKFFTVLGGDHTSAIGTWTGAAYALRAQGSLGLIWIDAHLDSHTPETSESGNLHGMPVATLLGRGNPLLTHLLNREPALLPENLCIIGARSYEAGELDLLKKLNVKIFFMDEVKSQGLKTVMQKAVQHVTQHTTAYGVSIDVDSIDPIDAPGTGVREENGLSGGDLCDALTLIANDHRLVGVEIAEFDPTRDENHITEKLIINMLLAITRGKIL